MSDACSRLILTRCGRRTELRGGQINLVRSGIERHGAGAYLVVTVAMTRYSSGES